MSSNQRPSRTTQSDHNLPTTSSLTTTTTTSNSRKKWSNLLPLFLVIVFIAEISFLGRLDLIKNADLLNSWTESFYTSSVIDPDSILEFSGDGDTAVVDGDGERCEEWLERQDFVMYGRDFKKEPVLVTGAEQVFPSFFHFFYLFEFYFF